MGAVDDVVRIAKSFEDKHFEPGAVAQCAFFVRHVFKKAGITMPLAQNPTDNAFPIGIGFANSFAGDEVGVRVTSRGSVKAGDIVMFFDTFGNFPPNTITHVGIAVDADNMVDRPTADRPVTLRSIDTFRFAEARRWADTAVIKVKINGTLQPSIPAYLEKGTSMVGVRALAKKLNWTITKTSPGHVLLKRNLDNESFILPMVTVQKTGFVAARGLPAPIVASFSANTLLLSTT